ncbi:MAG: hypothetical protein JW981_07470 [Anaerolineae bacterium]|nr:hypothetical protein [Anaerolineae bacterium]
MNIIHITAGDDRYTVRENMRRSDNPNILILLPWETEKGWDELLDYTILMREAQKRGLSVAWVIADPLRQPYARGAGFPLFPTEEAARTHIEDNGEFPPPRLPKAPDKPRDAWWAEEPKAPPLPLPKPQPLWLIGIKVLVFLVVLAALAGTAFISIPSAKITLAPEGLTYSAIMPISVEPELEEVDLQRNLIPSRRIGDEFEGYAEVATTGGSYAFSGYARGEIIFTNLLGQDYRVPEGTIVRTTSTSFPARFATLHDVVIPAFGQATASIEALSEGPIGNVSSYQISQVEGVAGIAVRVTNPYPISGAESEVVATVSEADKERVWELAAQQVLAEAYNGLQYSAYLQPGEFLPRQSLVIQAAPREAYTKMTGEQANTIGLTLRLLVTGEAVSASDAQIVAYRRLAAQLPGEYTLTDARFEYGEAAEEDVGSGDFSFYVTAYGYASAEIDTEEVWALIKGERIEDAKETLSNMLPLAREPEITVTPDWFPLIPQLPIRTEIKVVPGQW